MPQDSSRGLAAVMFADMVGFTSLMGRDEAAARRARDRQRDVVRACVEEFEGEVRQYYGDGTLSVFGSAVAATRSAIAIQRELGTPPEVPLRIGIHTGDIVDEGDGIYGDGVNVAARVEALSVPGGVLVSDKVYDEIKNQSDLTAVSLGSVRLKNVQRPVEIFALTNDGLAVPAPGHLSQPRRARRSTVAAVALCVAALALGLPWAFSSRSRAPTEAERTPSIAVLPFRNLSAESENAAFFADGLHDDILTQLTKVGSIDVIARTSVMQYAGTSKTVPAIGAELGVTTVLEGGVQRAGDRVRLNVQLIDATTDAHLWAETFDRALTAENVFAIQTEVAEAISAELRAVLTGEEHRALAQVPTESLEAYDHFLIASEALRRTSGYATLQRAQSELEAAVRADPEFVAALARLAYVHLDIYWNAFDRTEERLERARSALSAAERIDADDPEVLFTRGYFHYWGSRDYAAATTTFAAAQAHWPGDARLHEARAYVLRRVGAWDDAITEFEAAAELDPLNTEVSWALGQTRMYVGEYDLAQQIFERTLSVDPTMWGAEFEHAFAALLRDGDPGPMSAVVAQGSGEFPDVQAFTRWWLAYVDGDESRAFEVSRGLTEPIEQQAHIHPASLLNALVHDGLGRRDRAAAAADTALSVLLPLLAAQPDDPRVHAAIGTAYALQGLREQAVEAGNEAVRLLPVERDALDGPAYLVHLARIHALLGNTDTAAAIVRRLLPMPKRTSLPHILLEPAFSELREQPELGGSVR